VDVSSSADIQVNDLVNVKTIIDLAKLNHNDVQLELYIGALNEQGEIVHGKPIVMEYSGEDTNGDSIYTGSVVYKSSGLQGLAVRLLPRHEYLFSHYEPGLILWA
jgi:starch phosphorylase